MKSISTAQNCGLMIFLYVDLICLVLFFTYSFFEIEIHKSQLC